jgi:curved DNA-binding protein CbpA
MTEPRTTDDPVRQALALFGFVAPPTLDQLDSKRRELLAVWHPARYANLTNNPKKYMQMFTKAETMTKQINEAYQVLAKWLAKK